MDEKENRELIHKIEVEDEKDKKEYWESCCIRTNPHAVAYLGQIGISFYHQLLVADN